MTMPVCQEFMIYEGAKACRVSCYVAWHRTGHNICDFPFLTHQYPPCKVLPLMALSKNKNNDKYTPYGRAAGCGSDD